MEYAVLLKFLDGERPEDIVECRRRERDEGEWLIFIRTKSGRELRFACASEALAVEGCAEVERWRAGARPPTSGWRIQVTPGRVLAVFWALVLVFALDMAAAGAFRYWLVAGMVCIDHLWVGVLAALAFIGAVAASYAAVGLRAKHWRRALWAAVPLSVVFCLAAKAANAAWGRPFEVYIRGPVTALERRFQNIRVPRGDYIRVHLWRLSVLDERTGKTFAIDVPDPAFQREKVAYGVIWEDRFYRGRFGWFYRRIGDWDRPGKPPRVVEYPLEISTTKKEQP